MAGPHSCCWRHLTLLGLRFRALIVAVELLASVTLLQRSRTLKLLLSGLCNAPATLLQLLLHGFSNAPAALLVAATAASLPLQRSRNAPRRCNCCFLASVTLLQRARGQKLRKLSYSLGVRARKALMFFVFVSYFSNHQQINSGSSRGLGPPVPSFPLFSSPPLFLPSPPFFSFSLLPSSPLPLLPSPLFPLSSFPSRPTQGTNARKLAAAIWDIENVSLPGIMPC